MVSTRVLVYGGNGALGSVCVSSFKTKKVWVCSIDLKANEAADANIVVTELDDCEKQNEQVQSRVAEVLNGEKLDAIFCVAGGWAGGNASSKNLIKNCTLMWKQSVWSSVISAGLAAQHLKDIPDLALGIVKMLIRVCFRDLIQAAKSLLLCSWHDITLSQFVQFGLLQLAGAFPALKGTSGMIGYGMAKAAVHQLTKSLAQENNGLPNGACTVAILPVTLDTPMNRKWMPDADQTTWTPLEYIASMFDDWLNNKERPATGSLVKLTTKDGATTQTIE